ncbi:quinone oxidoreductase-like protein 1 isoform X2 [Haliotis rubra]|nr:quinone oxidoreductase-like protein 1 isoform X2 [Haliotis rubra]
MRCIKRSSSQDANVQKFILEDNEPRPSPCKNELLVQVKACGLSLINHKNLSEIFKKEIRESYPVGQDIAGIVTEIGEGVTSYKPGDAIVGILPLDSLYSGCGEFCCISEYDVVKKPSQLAFEDAAAAVGDCVSAYTALHYHAKVCAGDTLLVIGGATAAGNVLVQLGQRWGAKVLATYNTQAERQHLEGIQPPIAQVIELNKRNNILVSSVKEETGGVGVDCIVDDGVCLFTTEEDKALVGENYKFPVPHKYDIISCLGFAGKWITTQPDLQLDPPDCQQLLLRGASVSFLFPPAWTMASVQQGRYQHILLDVVDKLDKGTIKCKIARLVTMDDVMESLKTLDEVRVGKVVLKF